jgi:NAD(P)-dependent dehydrogenase (short-subunit alcohol dehydrogenase family)
MRTYGCRLNRGESYLYCCAAGVPHTMLLLELWLAVTLLALGALLCACAPLLALLRCSYLRARPRRRPKPARGLAVVVSGCDAGIGLALAERLVADGFTCFAGCLTTEGEARLTAREGFVAVRLDVTSDTSVAALREALRAWLADDGSRRLHAVASNAGVTTQGLVDWTPMRDFESCCMVNYLGSVRLVKALLPELHASAAQGEASPRVVFTSSMSGLVAFGGASAYSASKFALEGFADSLRLELDEWGVDVALVEPSVIRTSMSTGVEAAARAQYAALSQDVKARWGDEASFEMDLAIVRGFMRLASSPSVAVDGLLEAVTAARPEARYRVGRGMCCVFPLLGALPAWISDVLQARPRRSGRQ